MEADSQTIAHLWEQLKQHNSSRAREQLIVHYAPLVKYVAGRVSIGLPATVDRDDLNGYGIFGLMDAVEKFELDRGIKFETYALARIRGAMIDGLRANDWVPRSVRQKARILERTVADLEARLGRSATDAEIRSALNISAHDFAALLSEVKGAALVSLDDVWARDGDDDAPLRLGHMIEDAAVEQPGSALEAEQVERLLADAIDALPEREKLIITMYYYEGMTLKEIGLVLGVSESRVSQLHTRSILRLRGRLTRLRDALVG